MNNDNDKKEDTPSCICGGGSCCSGPHNHWLDCLVGCAVAASILGAVLPGTEAKAAPKTAPLKLSAMRKRRGEGTGTLASHSAPKS